MTAKSNTQAANHLSAEAANALLKRVAALREPFETWATGQGYTLAFEDRGYMQTYRFTETEHAWRGYCHAALAAQPTPEPTFTGIAARKLDGLKGRGYVVDGYSIQHAETKQRGFITAGGFVGWWINMDHVQPTPEPVAQDDDDDACRAEPSEWVPPEGSNGDGSVAAMALQGRDELPQLPPRSLLSLWAFISDSELAHIGLKARQKIENRVFELMQIYARSALQAARASLPAGGVVEPWGWAIVDKHGTAQAIRPRIKEFFGSIQGQQAFTQEDVKKMDREWPGLVPHCLVTLYTTPQPSETQGRRQMTEGGDA